MLDKKIFRKIVGIMAEYIDADAVEMYYPTAAVIMDSKNPTRCGFTNISDNVISIGVNYIDPSYELELEIFNIEFKFIDHMLEFSSSSTLTSDVNVDELIKTIEGMVNFPTISMPEPCQEGGDM